jgi:hypothetical protein
MLNRVNENLWIFTGVPGTFPIVNNFVDNSQMLAFVFRRKMEKQAKIFNKF